MKILRLRREGPSMRLSPQGFEASEVCIANNLGLIYLHGPSGYQYLSYILNVGGTYNVNL